MKNIKLFAYGALAALMFILVAIFSDGAKSSEKKLLAFTYFCTDLSEAVKAVEFLASNNAPGYAALMAAKDSKCVDFTDSSHFKPIGGYLDKQMISFITADKISITIWRIKSASGKSFAYTWLANPIEDA